MTEHEQQEQFKRSMEAAQEIMTYIFDLVEAVCCFLPRELDKDAHSDFVSIKVVSILNGMDTPRILPPHGVVVTKYSEFLDRSKQRWEPLDLKGYVLDIFATVEAREAEAAAKEAKPE